MVRERLETWLEDFGSKSDADWAVYQRMEPLTQQIRRRHYAVDKSRDTTPNLDKIVKGVMH